MSVQASTIRILEDRVVDQIAAGEVVERPASVVKELVENAVDAGSSLITVTLHEGGRTLIQVADDGCGMGEQDSLLAIERHATSKIEEIDDLVGIRSFGFRGEALPSISAVSKFEILTRRSGEPDGTRVRVHGGTLVDVRPAGAAVGTQIRVRNLFYNLPARKAFLRQASTELGHCVQVVARVALARPDIGFSLQHGSRHLIDAPVADSLAQRAADVLGPEARRLVPVDASEEDLRLTGLASPSHIHRATGNGAIYTFVNGRWVRDLVLRRAVQQAYRDLTPRGRYPIVVLHLEIAGEGVDVNVHPTKAEVQFRDPARVGRFVAQAVREAVLELVDQPRQTPPHLTPAGAGGTDTLPFITPGRPPVLGSRPPPADVETPAPPPVDSSPVAPVASDLPAPEQEAAPDVVAPPLEAGQPRLVGMVGERFAVGELDGALWMLDVGRLARRLQCLTLGGPGRAMLAPVVFRWRETDVRACEYYADELSEVGIDTVTFSPVEVAVRAIPEAFGGLDVEDVVRLALQAARRSSPITTTWGNRLPPHPVTGGLEEVARIMDAAREAGLPFTPRIVDPIEVMRGTG